MDKKHLFMPIAPSGSGKSTFFVGLMNKFPTTAHYSWDNLRLEMYDPDYKKAYQMSVDDSGFNNKVMKVFNELVKTEQNIYVDIFFISHIFFLSLFLSFFS